MSTFEDLSGPFQAPLRREYDANPTAFISARTWKARYRTADLVWNLDHSCYKAFGLGPAGYAKGQPGLNERGRILFERIRTTGTANGVIDLADGARLHLKVTNHPTLPQTRPHIGYHISCAALGWVDKTWGDQPLTAEMLYDPELRYGDGRTHEVAPWLTVSLVRG